MLRLESALYFGLFVGALSCNYIWQLTNTFSMFVLSLILTIMAIFSIMVGIEESVDISYENAQKVRNIL